MNTVVDFGPVDWGKIWGDRAGLVNEKHLQDLNAITAATHLANPGYWRNLFSSYPEVISNSGLISQRYTLPGRVPSYHNTSQDKPMIGVQSMNLAVDYRHEQASIEHQAFMAAPPPSPFKTALYVAGRETGATKVVEKVGDVVNNVGATASNLLDGVNTLSSKFKDLTSDADTKINQIFVVGGVIAAAYVYSLVK